MKESPVRIHRKYDETFKREAVQNWINSGKSATVGGEELGLKITRRITARVRLYARMFELVPAKKQTPLPSAAPPIGDPEGHFGCAADRSSEGTLQPQL